MRPVIFVLVCLLGLAAAEKARYDNYRVYRVNARSESDLKLISALISTNEYKYWMGGNMGRNAIIVPPHKRPEFAQIVKEHNLDASILIDNIQALMDEQELQVTKKSTKGISWTAYYTLEDIHAWLDELAADNSNVKVVSAGQSYEKRDIKGIQIINGDNLPGVILESGIHAREWIGPAATSWIVNEIINSPADSIWKQYNYVYFPSTNPDGFEYTHTTDRAWRKTRSPHKVGGLFTCYGVDPNRNWDFEWMNGGSSTNPCDETFAGPSAFSEEETKNLAKYFDSIASSYDIYVAFHSFSQLLMYPWGYTGQDTPLEATWKRIGNAAAADLKAVHGTSFDVGSIYDTIYQASGSSIEWYYGKHNSTLTYVFELRDTGKYGFVLPANQIIPSGEELQAAIERFLVEYQKLDVTKPSKLQKKN